jgi:hypothetical protein
MLYIGNPDAGTIPNLPRQSSNETQWASISLAVLDAQVKSDRAPADPVRAPAHYGSGTDQALVPVHKVRDREADP